MQNKEELQKNQNIDNGDSEVIVEKDNGSEKEKAIVEAVDSTPPINLSNADAINMSSKKALTIDILLILLGCLLMAFSTITFLVPHRIVSGGFSGFAFALFWLYEHTFMSWLSVDIWIIILNIPLFIVAIKIKGRNFGILALIGTVAFAVFIRVFQWLNLHEYLAYITLEEPLLATIFGGAVGGIGWGVLVRRGGSTGGSDMLSNVLHTVKPQLNYATFLLLIDGGVVLFSGVVNMVIHSRGYDIPVSESIMTGVRSMLYSFIAIFLTSMIAEYIIVGKNRAVTYFIICDNPSEMGKGIMENIKRGVTALSARGVYNDVQREVLVCVVKRNQAIKLKRLVFELDQNAFMFANSSQEVYGKGFLTELK